MTNGILKQKSVDLGIAVVLSALISWASYQTVPGDILRLPAFALAVRLFPSGVHAGKELDVLTNVLTTALLAAIMYTFLRMIFRQRTHDDERPLGYITKQKLVLIVSAGLTTMFFALLWFFWATTPFPHLTLRGMVGIGALGAFAAGALSRAWIRKPLIIIVSSAVGFWGAGTWAEFRNSDVSTQIIIVAWESLEFYWLINLILVCSVAISWFTTNYFVKRRS